VATNPMSAGKWAKIDPSPLHGAAKVLIVTDDEQVRRHAADVYSSLVDHVGIVSLVTAKVGKDAADHLAAGHQLDEFIPLAAPATGLHTVSLESSPPSPSRVLRRCSASLTRYSSPRTAM
jgi:hypothetical protein